MSLEKKPANPDEASPENAALRARAAAARTPKTRTAPTPSSDALRLATSPETLRGVERVLEVAVKSLRVSGAALSLFDNDHEIFVAQFGLSWQLLLPEKSRGQNARDQTFADENARIYGAPLRSYGEEILLKNRALQWSRHDADDQQTREENAARLAVFSTSHAGELPANTTSANTTSANATSANATSANTTSANARETPDAETPDAQTPDAQTRDETFCDETFLLEARCYAGAPMRNLNRQAFGALAVIDVEDRVLDVQEMALLNDLAALAAREFVAAQELQRAQLEAEQARRETQILQNGLGVIAQQNNQLQAAVLSAAVGIVVTDPNQSDNPIVFANPSFYQMTGYEPHEIIGRNCRFLQGAATNRDVIQNIRLAIRAGQPCRYTMVNYSKNGTPFWNDLTVTPVRDHNGRLVNFVGIQRDVTDSMEKEAAIKRANDELELRVQMRTLDLSRANDSLALTNDSLEDEARQHLQSKTKLERSRQQLRALAARLESVQEKERARISREIHDELGQELTGLKMQLAWLERRLSWPETNDSRRAELQNHLQEMTRQIDVSIRSVRRIASDLRPEVLDRFGLCEALEWQTQEFQKKAGIRCSFQCVCVDNNLERELATAIFRIAQEALTNIMRHARATRASLSLEQKDGALHLCISDNGVGLEQRKTDVQKTRDEKRAATEEGGVVARVSSLGIIGMEERAFIIGGTFSIESRNGTIVRVLVPLSDEPKTDENIVAG